MVGRKISALALLLSCVSAPLNANAYADFNNDCWQDREIAALKVQRFKTMLLVATLNCRDFEPYMTDDYNRFVRANRGMISEKADLVRQHFMRTHGPARGLHIHSQFETSMGNQYSNDDFDPRLCRTIADEARLAGQLSEPALMDLIDSVPDEDRFALCRAQPQFASRQPDWAPPQPRIYADPVREAAAPPPPPVAMPAPVQSAQTEWPDLAPIEPEGPARAVDPEVQLAAAVPPPPVPVAEPVAAPIQVAAVDLPKVAPAVDRMQAVRDAARALREALAVLEAEPPAVQ